MLQREDTNFQTETKKFAMDPDYDFTADDVEFEVFFRVLEPIYGWSTLSYISYPIEDIKNYMHVSVGQVEFSFISDHGLKFTPFSTQPCTEEQLAPFEGSMLNGGFKLSMESAKSMDPSCIN